jgi:hypothetical protein
VLRRMVENAAVVAVRQFLQRSTLRAPSGGLFLLCRCALVIGIGAEAGRATDAALVTGA